jgi:hypothetical protein
MFLQPSGTTMNKTNRNESNGADAFLALRICLEGQQTPAEEQALREVIESLSSVCDLKIAHGEIGLAYVPARIRKTEIFEAVNRAGFKPHALEAPRSAQIT